MGKAFYKNRKIIWKSKGSQIPSILIAFLFVMFAIWGRDRSSPFIFWGTIVLFGGGGVLQLFQLFNPKNLYVSPNSELGKTITKEQYQDRLVDPGEFTYTPTGVTISTTKGPQSIEWTEIATLFGFKQDLMTVDEITLDIFMTNGLSYRLSESMPGWEIFNQRLFENIPAVPADWEVQIFYPGFKTMLTLLYDKEGRTLADAEAACYKA